MKLKKGTKVISVGTRPVVGTIMYTPSKAHGEKVKHVQILKLDGGITFVTIDRLKPFVNYAR